MSRSPLRVGVPEDLLHLSPRTGHGKVWSRVLEILRERVRIVPLGGRALGRGRRRVEVVLADGHADLPEAAEEAPLVVQVHEAAWFEPELREVLDARFLGHIGPRTERSVHNATRVITPSESSRRDLMRSYGLDPERVIAVPHGVDPEFRPDARHPRASALAERGPYVLFAAMVHPRKNLDAVRAAVAGLASEGFPHRLVIVGGAATDRPDSRDLERAACADLPGAPGRVDRIADAEELELAAIMAGADALCLPSLYEGFGLTVLEAMACGTVPVVSNRGALPEVVGEAGIVVEPDAGPVRDALREILGHPGERRRRSEAAARRAHSFTWERAARGWLDALREAAA